MLIIGMTTRTALGHLGRPLTAEHSMVASYAFMLLALAFRLAAFIPSTTVLICLNISAAFWMLAFALYPWRFLSMLIRPRR